MTHSRRILCAALCSLALVLTFSASAVAEYSMTVLTFSSPVQLPTVLLPVGTYHFTVHDGDGGFITVTGTNSRFVTRFSVSPTTRAKAGEKVVMRSVEGKPSEVSALYPAGGTSGMEFIYHRAKK